MILYCLYSSFMVKLNPLSANPEKWSNTLKQIVGNLPTICLSVFDHFMNLALKGLMILAEHLQKASICKIRMETWLNLIGLAF